MKRTVLFFSCEPGGAEVLAPVVKVLQAAPKYEAVVLGYGHGLERFRKKGICCVETVPIAEDDPGPFLAHSPDFIITSATSLPERDMSEKHLWRSARRRGVKTIAFLDQWQNYAVRFSGCGEGERLAYLPDFINCINDIAKGEMIAEGFPEGLLLTFGHPYLSGIRAKYGRITENTGVTAASHTLLFVSEPLREHYGNSRGYDQYRALDLLLENVAASASPAEVVVKLHPKDDIANYRHIAGRFRRPAIRFIHNELSSLECLALSDRVFGMTSIMLVEAFLLGKQVVSLQPGLKIDDPCLLTRHNLIPLIGTHAAFDPFSFTPAVPESLDVRFDEERFMDFLAANM